MTIMEFPFTDIHKSAGYKRDVIVPLRKMVQRYSAARGLTPPTLIAGAGRPSMKERIYGGASPAVNLEKPVQGAVAHLDTRQPDPVSPELLSRGHTQHGLGIPGHEIAHGFQVSDPARSSTLAESLRSASPGSPTPSHDTLARLQNIRKRKVFNSLTPKPSYAVITGRHPELHADLIGHDFADFSANDNPAAVAALKEKIKRHNILLQEKLRRRTLQHTGLGATIREAVESGSHETLPDMLHEFHGVVDPLSAHPSYHREVHRHMAEAKFNRARALIENGNIEDGGNLAREAFSHDDYSKQMQRLVYKEKEQQYERLISLGRHQEASEKLREMASESFGSNVPTHPKVVQDWIESVSRRRTPASRIS